MNHIRTSVFTLGIALMAFAVAAGCSAPPMDDAVSRYRQGRYFYILLKKTGPARIRDIDIVFVGTNRQFHYNGPYGPGLLHSDGPNPLPKTTDVVVSWVAASGMTQTKTIHLSPDLMPRRRDNLVFLFRNDDSVIVQRFGASELDQAMEIEH